ncbi:Smad nuclear-interacting protein 1 [Trichostrongylus colubriformis]|uniref:Smad nuclear-interacting protein 1 n=1 Tax=Trichostrongylus colubriformis TaxID=6319 RepID=A0AAN8EST2_TRICO
MSESSRCRTSSPERKRAKEGSPASRRRTVDEPRRARQRSKSRSPSPKRKDVRTSRSEGDNHRRDVQKDRDSKGNGTSKSRDIKKEPEDEEKWNQSDSAAKSYGIEKRRKREVEEDEGEGESAQKSKDRWGASEGWGSDKKADPPKEKEKVNLGVSGKLAEDTNMYRGVLIKYNEPPEAKKPTLRWRLYPFKGEEALPVLHIHRQSAYLIGRDRKIADLPIDHPSCSKQHAVLQYRSVPFERSDGTKARRVLPYVELKEKDVLKFGFSSREFVVLNEKSAGDGGESDPGPNGSPGSD